MIRWWFALILALLLLSPAVAQLASTHGGKGTPGAAAPTLSWSGPSSGPVSVASSNFTVTLTGATFSGSQTVTIADGGLAGTVTPSVGSPGATPKTVTPTVSTNSFTFTYTPGATPATITLSQTNSGGWTPPANLTYTTTSTTTLDSANTASSISLDASKLVATATSSVTNSVSRALANHTTGKYYYEINITTLSGANTTVANGIMNNSMAVTGVGMGNTANSVGCYGNGHCYLAGPSILSGDAWVAGSNIAVAVDIGGKLFWIRVNGGTGWNASGTADPASGTGGISISGLTAGTGWYPGIENDASGNVITTNFGGSAYTQTPPTGFGNW